MSDDGGIGKLQRRLRAIPTGIKQAVQPALQKSAEEMADLMRQLAPTDTGALKDSIAITLPGGTTPAYSQPGGTRPVRENEVLITVGNTDVRYPHLVEYGAAHAPAQPFFWPAFRLTRAKATRRIKRAISKAVKDSR